MVITFDEHFEICLLVGTVCAQTAHLQATLGRSDGLTLSGHVVFSTAEIVLGNCAELQFQRLLDSQTGYNELTVEPVKAETDL